MFTGPGGTLRSLPPAVRTGGLRTTVRLQRRVVQVDRLVSCPPFGTRRSSSIPESAGLETGAHPERLVESNDDPRAAESALLNAYDRSVLDATDRHGGAAGAECLGTEPACVSRGTS